MKEIKFLIILICLVTYGTVLGQDKYIAFFTDKDNSPYSISEPGQYLSQRAIDRRQRLGIAFTEQDIPVNPDYISQLSGQGIQIVYSSRWFNAGMFVGGPADSTVAMSLTFVDSVALVGRGALNGQGRIGGRKFATEAANYLQNEFHNVAGMHEDGFRGEGIWIAVMDAGFPGVNSVDAFQHLFTNNRIPVTWNFLRNEPDVYQHHQHGTNVLSVMAAESTDYQGIAPDATYGLFVTEDDPTEYRIEEFNWLFATEMADSAGFDMINTSLGYYDFDEASMSYSADQMDGNTAVISRAAKIAGEKGILVISSAGNTSGLITAPADVSSVIAVGAVNKNGQKASFSSIGPTSDGRLKPDLSAFGVGAIVMGPSGTTRSASGTSLAAPIVTSLAAGVYERFPELTPAEVKALLISWSSRTTDPNNEIGYGIPTYEVIADVQQDHTESIKLFPNPASDWFEIHGTDQEILTVKMIDLQGRTLDLESVGDHKSRVRLKGVPAGHYLVEIETDSKNFIKKVVID